MPTKAYLKEHARLIKLLSVGEKLTKEMKEQKAELAGKGRIDDMKDALETALEDEAMSAKDGWALFDALYPEALKMFPEHQDLTAMYEAVTNKKTRRLPWTALSTLLSALEKGSMRGGAVHSLKDMEADIKEKLKPFIAMPLKDMWAYWGKHFKDVYTMDPLDADAGGLVACRQCKNWFQFSQVAEHEKSPTAVRDTDIGEEGTILGLKQDFECPVCRLKWKEHPPVKVTLPRAFLDDLNASWRLETRPMGMMGYKKKYTGAGRHCRGGGFLDSIIGAVVPKAFELLRGEIRKEYPPQARDILQRVGDWTIVSVSVRREPIQAATTSFLNLITAGQLEKAQREFNYDKLYHLGLYLTLRSSSGQLAYVMVDKREVIKLTLNPSTPRDAQLMNVSTPSPPVTFAQFMEKGQKAKGDSFFLYDAFTNNCQQFVLGLLRANGVLDSRAEQFINQKAEQLLDKLPGTTQDVARIVTDIGAIWNRVFEGKGTYLDSTQMPRRCMKGGAETALLTLTEQGDSATPLPNQTGVASFDNVFAQKKELMDALSAVSAVQQTIQAFLTQSRPTKQFKSEFVRSLQAIYQESTPQARGLLDEAFPVAGFVDATKEGVKESAAKARSYYKKFSSRFANVDAPTNAELQGGMGCGCGTPGCQKKVQGGQSRTSRAGVAAAKERPTDSISSLWPKGMEPKLPTAKELYGVKSVTELTSAQRNELSKKRQKALTDAYKAVGPEKAKEIQDATRKALKARSLQQAEEVQAKEAGREREAAYTAQEKVLQKEALERANNTPMAKFMRGLVKGSDFVFDNLAPMLGAPGVVLATAYKNLAGYNIPDSKYYRRPAADIIKDTLRDVAELGAAKAFSAATDALKGVKGVSAITKEANRVAKLPEVKPTDLKLPPVVPRAPPSAIAPSARPLAIKDIPRAPPARPSATSGLNEQLDDVAPMVVPPRAPPAPPRRAPKRGREADEIEAPSATRARRGEAPESAPLPPSATAQAPQAPLGRVARPSRATPSRLDGAIVPYRPSIGSTISAPMPSTATTRFARRLAQRTPQTVSAPSAPPALGSTTGVAPRGLPQTSGVPQMTPAPTPAMSALERLRQQRTAYAVSHRGVDPGTTVPVAGRGKHYKSLTDIDTGLEKLADAIAFVQRNMRSRELDPEVQKGKLAEYQRAFDELWEKRKLMWDKVTSENRGSGKKDDEHQEHIEAAKEAMMEGADLADAIDALVDVYKISRKHAQKMARIAAKELEEEESAPVTLVKMKGKGDTPPRPISARAPSAPKRKRDEEPKRRPAEPTPTLKDILYREKYGKFPPAFQRKVADYKERQRAIRERLAFDDE